jgi:hypothetical protein
MRDFSGVGLSADFVGVLRVIETVTRVVQHLQSPVKS